MAWFRTANNLSTLQVSIVLSAALVWYAVWRVLYELCFSPYRNIPGPFIAKFTRLWEFYDVCKQHPEQTYLRLHAKYGPVVRIAPNKFSFDHPSDARIIYALNSGFNKSAFYKGLGNPDREGIFSTQNEKLHANRKRKVAGLYTMSTMVNYEPAVDRMTSICMEKLANFAESGMLLALDKFLQYYAFDVIARITYDRDFGMMERMEDYEGVIKMTEKSLRVAPKLAVIPETVPWLFRLAKLMARKPLDGEMTAFNRRNIYLAREKHATPNPNPKAEPFVYKCLALEAQGKCDPVSIMDSCGANIKAGSDTTGSTLTAIMYYLYKNSTTLQQLRKEIDEAASEGLISDPVAFQEAQTHLPYLNAVIKEGLRLHPAVGIILPRSVLEGGANLAGHFFPAGTEVGSSAVALHMNKRYHGPDCTEWRPERWLDPDVYGNDPERKLAMNFSFGGGNRVCLGKNISLLEMTKLVPQIVRRYDIEFERSAETGEVIEAKKLTSFFVWLRFNCYIRERTDMRAKM